MAHITIDARIINSSTGRYVERLLSYLQQVDRTNHYTVLVPSKDLDYWKPVSPRFSVVAADFDNYSFAEQTKFNRFLKRLAPDLVHFCMPQQPVRYRGKHVTTFHDLTLVKTYNSDKNWLIYHGKQAVGKWLFKRVARDSTAILAPSEFTKRELVAYAGIPPEKVTVTYEAAEPMSGGSHIYKLPFKRYLLYVGQQSDYKNIRRLAEAHQRLLADQPDLGLVLAGRLNASALANKTLFERKKYRNIIFTDFVTDAQLNWLYDHAAAYVFASLMEGFGLPGLEAMTHGIPLVSSNATCLPEVYGAGAHYFNPLDVADVSGAIRDVLLNDPLRRELVRNGYKQIKKYSWKKMAEQTLGVYEAVLRQD